MAALKAIAAVFVIIGLWAAVPVFAVVVGTAVAAYVLWELFRV